MDLGLKAALVTGGSDRIGKAIARKLAQEGGSGSSAPFHRCQTTRPSSLELPPSAICRPFFRVIRFPHERDQRIHSPSSGTGMNSCRCPHHCTTVTGLYGSPAQLPCRSSWRRTEARDKMLGIRTRRGRVVSRGVRAHSKDGRRPHDGDEPPNLRRMEVTPWPLMELLPGCASTQVRFRAPRAAPPSPGGAG